jgi:hypothetical protein
MALGQDDPLGGLRGAGHGERGGEDHGGEDAAHSVLPSGDADRDRPRDRASAGLGVDAH